ncbi:hypothetical protein HDK90DRAFT_541140 [Phyllosticta capitalensis]|uniref:RNA polymerase II subunit A C-terminal domain phosphatase n=1 Tax=Phyllosticta capitalensis TaxID=121624 RepID=A0ABR1YFI5_9PEZI
MLFTSPKNLHYPVTVTKLLHKQDDKVKRFAKLFSYTYTTSVTEVDEFGQDYEVKKKFPAEYEAEKDGAIKRLYVKEGDVIARAGVKLLELEEECAHEIQWGGMCANCGKDMEEVSYNTTVRDVDRATIVGTPVTTQLKISEARAVHAEEEAKRRLLSSKKLSLVVDLDQTIIQATVDETVGEWKKDPNNPNYDAVKDVHSFYLPEVRTPGGGSWYFIKQRPGLKQFLEEISKIYELHIYTMGTRPYADNITAIIDADHKIFGDRVLSRDESGSMAFKSLRRLFPTDTKMVVIIDDRGDVWHWNNHLIKVTPYDFFVGIGDINSSFLPKRQDALPVEAPAKPRPTEPAPEGTDGESPAVQETSNHLKPQPLPPNQNGEATTLEDQLVAMSGGDNPELLQQKIQEQQERIAREMEERPLLRRQELLDKADAEADATQTHENGADHRHRHNLLNDDDDELFHLETNLRAVHRNFYETYEKRRMGTQGGRIAQLKGEKSPKKRPIGDLDVLPDIADVLPAMKRSVLKGVSIVFTGVVPLGTQIQSSEWAVWARSFGAQISEVINKRTTHVVAARNRRTQKVRQAARHPHIKIVTTDWLKECCVKWKRMPESPHLIHVEPDERGLQGSHQGSPLDELEDSNVLSSSEDSGTVDTELEELGDGDDLITDEDELAEVMPTMEMADKDMAMDEKDRQEMMDELAEFLGDSDTEEDTSEQSDPDDFESDASAASNNSVGMKKRKRRPESAENSEEESDATVTEDGVSGAGVESKLQRRKKRAFERVSSLTNVSTADHSSGLPSPDTTGPEEGVEGDEADAGDANEQDDDEDDDALEAELLAEFEKDDEDEGDE